MKSLLSYERLVVALIVVQVLLSFVYRSQPEEAPKSVDELRHEVVRDIAPGVRLFLALRKGTASADSDSLSSGPHQVELRVQGSVCKSPGFWIRLVGDALVEIELKEHSDFSWKGSFYIPMVGSYRVDTRWYGCSTERLHWDGLKEPIDLYVPNITHGGVVSTSLFSDGAWVRAKELDETKDELFPDYVWKKPVKDELSSYTILQSAESSLLLEGTKREQGGFFKFHDLGNYELLCFMGSESASQLREAFLSIRPRLFAHQRPFKFHYYNVTNLVHPDANWNLDTKQRVRKCKHILLSVDDLEGSLSQDQFKEQLTIFVHHLLKLMDDETFPIRVLTTMEPPMMASQCHSSKQGTRTTGHPCNDAIKGLFESNAFPERVHLFDNTDLSSVQFDQNQKDVRAVVALRVFVVVGKQVADWREVGQRGMIDGLHRNGVVEPNFELIPYTGWS